MSWAKLVPSEALRIESISLPFSAASGHLHSLANSPLLHLQSTSSNLCSYSHITFSAGWLLQLLMRKVVIVSGRPRSRIISPALNHSCKGFRDYDGWHIWERGHYSVYHIRCQCQIFTQQYYDFLFSKTNFKIPPILRCIPISEVKMWKKKSVLESTRNLIIASTK